jgi:phage shock protein A
LAGGAGYSIGTFPLTGAGALTGFALYEALRAMTNDDTSSLGAAAVGGVAGAATSSAIGGIGLAVGGTAVSVGMAPMIAAGAITGLGVAGLSRFLQQGIDPEKLLDLVIEEMCEELVYPREVLINLITTQKCNKRQYDKVQAEANNWRHRAQVHMNKGEESLARECLMQKKARVATAKTLKADLDDLTARIEPLKKNFVRVQAAIADAKNKRDLYKAQAHVAKAQAQLHNTVGTKTSNGIMSAFGRMEEKILTAEARSHAAAQLAGADLESQFARLESADMDLELEAMKDQLLNGSAQYETQL